MHNLLRGEVLYRFHMLGDYTVDGIFKSNSESLGENWIKIQLPDSNVHVIRESQVDHVTSVD